MTAWGTVPLRCRLYTSGTRAVIVERLGSSRPLPLNRGPGHARHARESARTRPAPDGCGRLGPARVPVHAPAARLAGALRPAAGRRRRPGPGGGRRPGAPAALVPPRRPARRLPPLASDHPHPPPARLRPPPAAGATLA